MTFIYIVAFLVILTAMYAGTIGVFKLWQHSSTNTHEGDGLIDITLTIVWTFIFIALCGQVTQLWNVLASGGH